MFAKKAVILAFLTLSLTASAAPVADSTTTPTGAVLAKTGGAAGNAGATGNTGASGSTGTTSNTGASGNTGTTGNTGNTSTTTSNTGNAGTASTSATAAAASGDLQSSLSLDPSLIQTGFEQNGQANVSESGQVASITSSNNFINYCASTNLPGTNGTQITTGSCNPAPMGIIAATTAMPSSKFVYPANLDTVQANTNFTIQMAINNLNTGNFVNPNTNYFAAPQFTDSQGLIVGHSHVVIEQLQSMTQTTPTDPTKFAFFKGLNSAAVNGMLTADVAGGLPAGVYKLSSINSAANHQPALVAVAQHGSLDDAVYFTVSANGQASNNTGATGTSTSAATGASSSADANAGAGADTGAAAAASSSQAASASASSAAANTGNQGTGKGNTGAAGAAGAASTSKAAAASASSTAAKTGAQGASTGNAGAAASGSQGAAASGASAAAKGGNQGAGASTGKGKRWLWE